MQGGIDVVTGGTDVHLVLVDLTSTELDGKTAEGFGAVNASVVAVNCKTKNGR
jgi:glycine/serine hydroxymethyltransferase